MVFGIYHLFDIKHRQQTAFYYTELACIIVTSLSIDVIMDGEIIINPSLNWKRRMQ